MPRASRTRFYRALEWVLLVALLVSALALRTWNINFDQGAGSHPDERSTACFVATTIGLPHSWDEFLDPQRSPLNPMWDQMAGMRRSFTYGHFPLYLGVGMGNLLHELAPLAARFTGTLGLTDSIPALMARADTACDGLAVAGRLTIALLDTVTVLLVFLLGCALFAHPGPRRGDVRWIPLLAAAFYAFTAQAIQLSHFFAMDPASTTFTVLAVLGGVWMVQRRTWGAATVCGLGMGLAVASKFSALPVLAIPVTAGVLLLWQSQSTEAGTAASRIQFYAIAATVWSMLIALVAFVLTSPYAVLDWSSFIQATLVEQGRMVRGVADFPFTRQYRGTPPYWYFIEQQLAWGMWWPLGLMALLGALGGLALLVQTLWRGAALMLGKSVLPFGRLALANAVVWAWVLPYFGITGAFLAKFNRYMSPILPFAALMAAGVVWGLWRWGTRRESASGRGRWLQLLASLAAVVTLLASVFWSAAYVNGVYGREHTWITASRWAYENIPSGSVILWELWDDPIPLRNMPGNPDMNLANYGLTHIDWSPYEEDTAEKYEILRARLQAADYVAYSSKRIYGSVDNLPERYPMTTRYYAGMWDGSLGYEVALHVTSPPQLFGWTFPDHNADESWSLYDHPQVTIFRKVRELSDAEFDAYFARAWEEAVPYYRGEDSFLSPVLELLGLGASQEGGGLLGSFTGLISGQHADEGSPPPIPDLMLNRSLASLPLVDEYRWNNWANGGTWRAIVVWWAGLWLLGMLAWPIVFRASSALRDRGYLFSRSAGWLLTGWVLWIGASAAVWHNTVRNAWLVVAGLALVSGLLAWQQRRSMAAFVRRRWRVLALGEICFVGAFLLFVQIRMWNPDLWQPWNGGEKFMEMAFLNGILRSPTFPPVNPHFAGGIINYYYYGLYLVAYLIKITGIYAEVAFNLAIATLFGLTALHAFGVVYNVVGTVPGRGRRANVWRWGAGSALLGLLFVVVLGNLDSVAQLVRNVQGGGGSAVNLLNVPFVLLETIGRWTALLLQGGPLPAFDFWGPSRVIPFTINEFPFWTFLFADLHPHMIALPFGLLALCMAVQVLASTQRWYGLTVWGKARMTIGLAFASGLIIGALAVINLWDYPTYLGIALLVVLLAAVRGVGLLWSLAGWALGAGFSYLLYSPFFTHYVGVGASGIGRVQEPDALGPWLLIWGFFVFVLLSWMWWKLGQPVEATPRRIELALSRGARLLRRDFERLPRVLRLISLRVVNPTLGTMFALLVVGLLILLGLVAVATGWWVLAISLTGVILTLPLMARINLDSQLPTALTAMCAFTGFLILAGTQVVFVRDFLQGGEWYRMNTLFKFYMHVWLLFGVSAALAFAELWQATGARNATESPLAPHNGASDDAWITGPPHQQMAALAIPMPTTWSGLWPRAWRIFAALLLAAGFVYPLVGTPARVDNRMPGWRPPIGTLDGLAFMEQGVYAWPDEGHRIDMGPDHDVILWLLEHVRGNLVIAESAEVDYYRAGGSRIASFTGLSGLMGKHENEQRDGMQVAMRHELMREFWNTSDLARTLDLAREMEIALVYVGQLERHQHPQAEAKLAALVESGVLVELYANEGSTLYAFPARIEQTPDGSWIPVEELPDVG